MQKREMKSVELQSIYMIVMHTKHLNVLGGYVLKGSLRKMELKILIK